MYIFYRKGEIDMKSNSFFKRTAAAVTALLIVAGSVPFEGFYNNFNSNVITVSAGTLKGDEIFADDNYSSNTMFEVNSLEDLKAFADAVNSGKNFEGKTVKLTNNITEAFKTPIGKYVSDTKNYPFKGTFDGQDFIIKLEIEQDDDCVGLFGYAENSTIKDITVTGSVKGKNHVGSICGYLKNGVISGCFSKSATVSGSNNIGGIAGKVQGGTVISCGNLADVTYTSGYGGGLIGYLFENGSLVNSYNRVKNCGGGWVGNYVSGVIYNCFNIGGALFLSEGSKEAMECYYDKDMDEKYSGSNHFIKGLSHSACLGSSNLYNSLNSSAKSQSANNSNWHEWIVCNNEYPELCKTSHNAFKNYSEKTEFHIDTFGELNAFAYFVNSGYTFENKTVYLDADIPQDFNSVIGNSSNIFKGTFDGQGHTVNLALDNPEYQSGEIGLFGCAQDAVIKNITVTGMVKAGDDINYAAGVCGFAENTIINNCTSNADITGTAASGGICASVTDTTIVNCINNGSLQQTNSAGICLDVLGNSKIYNCVTTGHNQEYDISKGGSGAEFFNCFWLKKAPETFGSVKNCYYDKDISLKNLSTEMTELAHSDCISNDENSLYAKLNANADSYCMSALKNDEPVLKKWKITTGSYPTLDFGKILYDIFDDYNNKNTFSINTIDELNIFAELVRCGKDFENKTVLLETDITDELTDSIGDYNMPFKGTFNGKGHSIKLNIDDPGKSFVGLFSALEDATVKNVAVTGSVKGEQMVGGICGFIVNNSVILNCQNKAAITGEHTIGGICAESDSSGTIINCINNAEIECSKDISGGITGYFENGKIYNCNNAGKINGTAESGGLVGKAITSEIKNCFNRGICNNNAFVGFDNGSIYENCYYDSGDTGVPESNGITGLESAKCKGIGDGSLYAILNSNAESYDLTTIKDKNTDYLWKYWEIDNNDYPVLETKKVGTDIFEDYDDKKLFELYNIIDLYGFAATVNSGKDFAGKKVILKADIINGFDDVIGKANKFCGSFDGQNHIVKLAINNNSYSYAALFGFADGATIKNVITTGEVNGTDMIGGICARIMNNGTIDNCTNKANLIGNNDSNYASLEVGGICAYLNKDCHISNCVNSADITSQTNGDTNYVGGIAGVAFSDIYNCMNTGDLISKSGNTASAGGICGQAGSSNLIISLYNCINTGSISTYGKKVQNYSTACSGGIAGRSNMNAYNCINTSSEISAVLDEGDAVVGSIFGENFNTTVLKQCYTVNPDSIFDAVEGITEVDADQLAGKTDHMVGDKYFVDLLNEYVNTNKDTLRSEKGIELKKWHQGNVYPELIITNPDDIQRVVALISAIGTVECTGECKEKIDTANAAYGDLNDTEKGFVTNYATLELANKIYDVMSKIDAIGTVECTGECKEKIDTANAAYGELDNTEKVLVTNYAALELANKIYDVMSKIDAIGTVECTDECKGKIDAAGAAYGKLNDTEKALVTNYATLELANKIYDVMSKIDAIGTVECTDECKEKIDAASTAYGDLNDTEKALVTNYTTLTDAETRYSILKVIAEINAIGTVEYTDTCKERIELARTDYEDLKSDEEKAAVVNRLVLEYAENLYSALEAKNDAEDERDAAKAERNQAVTAKEAAEAERDQAVTAKEAAEGAKEAAEAERNRAVAAKEVAEAERNQAVTAKEAAEDERDQALTDKATAEDAQATAEKAAETAKEEAEAAKTAQAAAEKTAEEAQQAQKTAEAAAETAKAEAEVAKTAQAAAEKTAEDAQQAQKTAEAAAETAKAEAAAAKTAQAAAEKTAEEAQQAQKTAEAAAETAKAEAEVAKTAQAAAEKTAEEAQQAQKTAEAAAETAKAAAEAAKTAQAAAEEKTALAVTAKETAEKAKLNAENAKTAAEEAQAEAEEALKLNKKDAAEKIAAANTAAEEAKTAQEAAEKAQEIAETEEAAAKAAQEAAEKAQALAETEEEKAKNAQKTAEEKAETAKAEAAAAKTAQAVAEKAAETAAAAQKTAEERAETAETEAAAAKTAQAIAEKEAADAQAAKEAAEQEKEKAIQKAAEEKAEADKEAAGKVIAKIDEISEIEQTNECENSIVAARSAYDALTDEQKQLVTNYEKLVKAETEYSMLPQTGYSGIHKVFAGFAALMGMAGIGLAKKRRKEDEE